MNNAYHVENCYSGNWNAVTPGSHKQFNLCAPWGVHAVQRVSEPLCSGVGKPVMQIKNCWPTDKEVLGKCCWTATLIQLTFFPNHLLTLLSI